MQREGFELDCNLTTNINYLMDHCLGEQRIPIKSRLRYTKLSLISWANILSF